MRHWNINRARSRYPSKNALDFPKRLKLVTILCHYSCAISIKLECVKLWIIHKSPFFPSFVVFRPEIIIPPMYNVCRTQLTDNWLRRILNMMEISGEMKTNDCLAIRMEVVPRRTKRHRRKSKSWIKRTQIWRKNFVIKRKATGSKRNIIRNYIGVNLQSMSATSI